MPKIARRTCFTDYLRAVSLGACKSNRRFLAKFVVLAASVLVIPLAASAQTLVVTSSGSTVSQGATLTINTVPNMPNLVLSVNGGSSCDTVSYAVAVSYSDRAGYTTDATYVEQDEPGDQSVTVSYFGVLEGGVATVSWQFDGVNQSSTLGFFINGSNPQNSDVDAYVSSGPWFIRNLINHESGYQQFDGFGNPIWGSPDGIGLMQLEPPARASLDQDFWSWPANLADGLSWLNNTKKGPAYNSWNNELQQMQSDMAPGQRYPPNTGYSYCYFSYPQNGNDSYADGDWIHYYNGNYFIFWNHSNLSWDIDTTGYVANVCNTPAL